MGGYGSGPSRIAIERAYDRAAIITGRVAADLHRLRTALADADADPKLTTRADRASADIHALEQLLTLVDQSDSP